MLAIERKNEILDKLRAEQRVLVSDLAAYYHVTEETIRRDLDKLGKGRIRHQDLRRRDPRQQHEDRPVLYHPEQDQRGSEKSDRSHCQPPHRGRPTI